MVRALIGLICLLAAGEAVSAADGLDNQAARGHFDAGRAYYKRGEFERAITEFLEARREFDHPALDYNIGLAYEALGDAARAVKFYERFLSRSPAAMERAAAESAVKRLSPRIGFLFVDPPRASESISVDGVPLEPGDEGATEGKHRLTLLRDGVAVKTLTVQVHAGARTHVSTGQLHARPRWWMAAVVGGIVVSGLAIGLGVGLGVGLGTRDSAPRMGSIGSLGVP